MNRDEHYWINTETLYCPESGDMHITEHGDGRLLYDNGGPMQMVLGKACPECGEDTATLDTEQPVFSEAYQREGVALDILADGENEEEED